jgi:hypothetical protein
MNPPHGGTKNVHRVAGGRNRTSKYNRKMQAAHRLLSEVEEKLVPRCLSGKESSGENKKNAARRAILCPRGCAPAGSGTITSFGDVGHSR